MSRPSRSLSIAALVVVCVGALAASATAATSKPATLHIMAIKPHIETLDFPPPGKSPGDLYVFDATIVKPNGRTVIGRVRGTQTSIKLENGTETVQGLITYELGPGNELVIGGLSSYPLIGTELVKGKKYERPVLGGSGRYAGASGTLTSRYLGGGRYDQVFRLTY